MSDLADDPEVILNMGWIEENSICLESLQYVARYIARQKGFFPEDVHSHVVITPGLRIRYATCLALIGTEVSEALEELRLEDFNQEKFGEELADILLRLCDLAEATGVDLCRKAVLKLEKNMARPPKHGKVF